MRILGFCNLKGGVGKTTSCQNIACAFALMGRKVAVIDMDPQSNLSAGFGILPEADEAQVFDLLCGSVNWDDVIRHREGIDLVPGSLNLSLAEINRQSPINSDTALKEALNQVDPDRYDYIFLDSPPQLGIFTRNVLTACDKILVPMDGGHYSLIGLKLLNDSIDLIHEHLNPGLEILGIIMTNYNSRLYIARQVYAEVQGAFPDVLFESFISQNVSLIEASRAGKSIFSYSPKSKAAGLYKSAAIELLKRLGDYDEPEPEPEPVTVKAKKQAKQAKSKTHEAQAEPDKQDQVQAQVQEKPKAQPQAAPKPVIRPDYGPIRSPLKQHIIDLLDDSQKAMWTSMLGAAEEIEEYTLNVDLLRDDFENCDKSQYTFYVLPEKGGTLAPIMDSDRITDFVRLVLKWDENGSVEAYM